ncbi:MULTISPECIES: FmdB family zinc ribbon protein [unclassified Crossiella]|uniref:FmdB family zinc ribbon protein n=1 Tax=unclassified Crossiella TaxID=2620835 RepID=UPI001FFF4D1C|nr:MULTISPECIES: FmdB family zinc ribbon protein [unclassified Crossiella]MCK2238127.1 FmdB family transcriptional regulator [Crossiella sp. S99.2]MCK2256167.1 FmdB family transcriptional regulator [Crossiella sp. S99.1]
MPTYQYACTECEHRFEAVQAFTDATLTECPNCSGKLRKLFGAVGIVFKGSGFYRTDSRGSGGSSTVSAGSTKSESKSDSGSSSTKSESSSPASSSASSTSTSSAAS